MTIEPSNPRAVYIIATTGPYALRDSGGNPWPYAEGGLSVAVAKNGVLTVLASPADYAVSPDSGIDGNLTLTAGALAAHMGGQLIITRATVAEQAWAATQGPREVGLAAQLDRLTMIVQEHDAALDGAIKLATGSAPPALLTAGRTIIYDGERIVSGPTEDDIAAAQGYAAQVAADKLEVAALKGEVDADAAQVATAAPQATLAATNAALSADAANTALLMLAQALVHGIGATSVQSGDLILTYNEPFITSATIVDGELIVTYGA